VHHSGLAMRAASLAIGGLAALPFLDSRSFQHSASELRTVDGGSHGATTISIMSQKTALIGGCPPPVPSLSCSWTCQCKGYPSAHSAAPMYAYAAVLVAPLRAPAYIMGMPRLPHISALRMCVTKRQRDQHTVGRASGPCPIPVGTKTQHCSSTSCCNCAGTNVAAVVVAVLYSLSYFKPAGAPVWPRAVSLPFLVAMLQVSCKQDWLPLTPCKRCVQCLAARCLSLNMFLLRVACLQAHRHQMCARWHYL
jgi:hypothetical protein